MSTRALVTGATGHIGEHVVRSLVAAGWTPIAFVRAGSDQRALAALGVERQTGDLLDAESVDRAMGGVEVVFHVGAVHRNFAADPADIERPAVDGTRNVLAAARRRDVRRVVYTSTGATVGFAKDPARPLDETSFHLEPRAPYIRGKVLAERLALEEAARPGAPEIVVLNPSGVVGPGDRRITPATRAIIGLAQGDPAFLHLCLTDVRDVAAAHVLAATKGQPGARYLVTGDVVSPRALSALFHELAGVKPPVLRPPRFLLRLLGWSYARAARKTGGDIPFDPAALDDLAGGHLAYDSTRSRRELGVTYRPAREALTDTLRWLLYLRALKPRVAAKVAAALGPRAAPEPDWEL